MDPVRWMIAQLMDDASYGWGVWSGLWTGGEWNPLWPDLGWRLIIGTAISSLRRPRNATAR
jgi:hypothetical protein